MKQNAIKGLGSKLQPVRMTIKEVGIDVPILPSKIDGTTWQTTSHGVSYLTSTPAPGVKGNTIIYGHNFANLLVNLPESKPGTEINIYMNDGSERTFKIVATQEVDPSQTEILAQTSFPQLTVYTCSGFLDNKRFVVVATPV